MSFTQEDYQEVLTRLAALSDEKYKEFNERLIPGTKTTYGVRIPLIRSMAKEIARRDGEGFLAVSKPDSFEETMLRGFVVAATKADLSRRLVLVENFLPLIDNWAVCDTFCSSFHLKKPDELKAFWQLILPLFEDEREFYARFAAVMSMNYITPEGYSDIVIEKLASMTQPQYYVQMAVAWALSVCYVKLPQKTEALLKEQRLPKFTQNKCIQKIRESLRVSREEKDALLAYKL